jgi:hypothetical protein
VISEHISHFGGKPVASIEGGKLPDPATHAVRLESDYPDRGTTAISVATHIDNFAAMPGAEKVTALVLGNWLQYEVDNHAGTTRDALIRNASKLPSLRALFIGDMTSEESEMSWISHTDYAGLWAAFPALEEFGVRGGQELSLGKIAAPKLQKLRVEGSGMSAEVLGQILAANAPNVTHLEIWPGTGEYGLDYDVAALAPLFTGKLFPKLKYLGIRNCEFADDVAGAIAASPLLSRITILDLSLGNLSDDGANALAKATATAQLQLLDIHHHYCTEDAIDTLTGLGIEVNAEDPQDAEDFDGDRMISVTE